VRWLALGSNRIGDKGAKALAESPYLDNVEHLLLTQNPLTIAGWRLLKRRFGDRFIFGFYRTEADWAANPDPMADADDEDE